MTCAISDNLDNSEKIQRIAMKTSALFVLAMTLSAAVAFRLQGVAVKGRLMCGSRPLEGAKVKIYDVDRSEWVD